MVSSSAFTFRLRRCPDTADEAALCRWLSRAFGDVTPNDIRIQSLATTLDPWGKKPVKTATLNFAKLPSAIESHIKKGEWKVEVDGSPPLILDTHFLGMTPLNDVEAQRHDFE